MEYLRDEYGISIGRACKVVDLSRSMFYYKSKKDDGELICKLEELALNHPTRGLMTIMAESAMKVINGIISG